MPAADYYHNIYLIAPQSQYLVRIYSRESPMRIIAAATIYKAVDASILLLLSAYSRKPAQGFILCRS